MTASGPGGGATPEERDGTPSVPEEVWRKFLADSEQAIRATAPKEPSARERTQGHRPRPPATDPARDGHRGPGPGAGAFPGSGCADAGTFWGTGALPGSDARSSPDLRPGADPRPRHRPGKVRPGAGASPGGEGVDAVGDLWCPQEPWAGPAWHELDGRARLRRAGRVVGTAAAVALALTAWSQLSTGPGTPARGPGDTIGRRLEETALPTAASPAPGASASPAAFQPAPSAVPRASAPTLTID
ncbi:hypothetical protein ABTX99_06280 [Streptomyces flaveolus]|uniref:hypothetical protein n=1 Tax=Streptomyces flaveolus TaxID=67297 RepID=UPI00332F6228